MLGPVHTGGDEGNGRRIHQMNDALELAGKTLPAGAPDEIRGQEAQVLEDCPKEFFGHLRGSDFAGMGKGVAGWGSRAADAGERAELEAQGIANVVETDAVGELGVEQADDMTPRALNTGEAKAAQKGGIYHVVAGMTVEKLRAEIARKNLAPERVLDNKSISSIDYNGRKIRVSRVNLVDESFRAKLDEALADQLL